MVGVTKWTSQVKSIGVQSKQDMLISRSNEVEDCDGFGTEPLYGYIVCFFLFLFMFNQFMSNKKDIILSGNISTSPKKANFEVPKFSLEEDDIDIFDD